MVLKAGVDGGAVDGVSTGAAPARRCTGSSRTTGSGPTSSPAPPGGRQAFVPAGVPFASIREAHFDRIADAIEAHLDLRAIEKLISQAADSGSLSSEASG